MHVCMHSSSSRSSLAHRFRFDSQLFYTYFYNQARRLRLEKLSMYLHCPLPYLRAQPSGAGPVDSPLVSCPSRSSRYLCVVMFWSYLAIAGNAPSGQSHLCHPFTCGSPASPLLSRTPITKYISSCKVNSSTSTLGIISAPSKAVKCSKGSNLNLCH